MRILVVGSGGREHALCWKITASPLCDKLYCAPGNAGIAAVVPVVALDPTRGDVVSAYALDNDIELVVIGPEAPLVAGVADALRQRGSAVFGPGKAAAALEGSKTFAKEFCQRHGIPTARAVACADTQVTAQGYALSEIPSAYGFL